jgi:hypothetical protein
MTTTTATLADFLLARIAEDEAAARAAHTSGDGVEVGGSWHVDIGFVRGGVRDWSLFEADEFDASTSEEIAAHIARHDPARVLAECEAKRRIVERCGWIGPGAPAYHLAQGILGELVLPYADHAEFREEWRP